MTGRNPKFPVPKLIPPILLGARAIQCYGYSEVLRPEGLQLLLTGKHTLVSDHVRSLSEMTRRGSESTVNIRTPTKKRLVCVRLRVDFGRLQTAQ